MRLPEGTESQHVLKKSQGTVRVLSCEGASSLRVSQYAPTDPAMFATRRGDT